MKSLLTFIVYATLWRSVCYIVQVKKNHWNGTTEDTERCILIRTPVHCLPVNKWESRDETLFWLCHQQLGAPGKLGSQSPFQEGGFIISGTQKSQHSCGGRSRRHLSTCRLSWSPGNPRGKHSCRKNVRASYLRAARAGSAPASSRPCWTGWRRWSFCCRNRGTELCRSPTAAPASIF